MSDPKNFYARKMDWLMEVAGIPGISARTLAAAIACADASFPPGVVKKKQWELASRLGKPQSAISQGCADLFRMGFLTAEENGNRTVYSLNFDVEQRNPPQKRALKGALRSSAGADKPISAGADEALSATPDKAAVTTNIRTGVSTSSAPADEHYIHTSHKGAGEAPAPYTNCGEDRSVDHGSDDQDRAPRGAVLQGRLINEIEETFGRPLLAHHAEQLAALVDQIDQTAVYARLATYRAGVEAGTIAPVSMARWLRQQGLVEVIHAA